MFAARILLPGMAAALAAGALAVGAIPAAAAPPATDRLSGTDYALATCLTQRAAGPLRDEGYSLGTIAIEDMGRSPLDFAAVREAVRRELARRPMTTVHIDAPVDRSDRPALLAHCLAISRSAPVRAALARLGQGAAR